MTAQRRLIILGATAAALGAVLVAEIALRPSSVEANPYERPGCQHTALIGDSITVGDATQLAEQLPGAIINARSGRTTEQAIEAARGIKESYDIDCWVFALGTNDVGKHIAPPDSAIAIEVLLTFPAYGAKVWWVPPVFGPGADYDSDAYTALIPDTVSIIRTDPPASAFQTDGVHPTHDGYIARRHLIVDAVNAG